MAQKFQLVAEFDPVREVAFGGIGANYAALGAVLSNPVRLVSITNTTDAEVYISIDGTTNHLRLTANSFKLLDISANKSSTGFYFPANTQFYIKRVSAAPTSGSVWIETVFAS